MWPLRRLSISSGRARGVARTLLCLSMLVGAGSCFGGGVAPAAPPLADRDLAAVIDGPDGEAWFTRHPDGDVVLFGRHSDIWQDQRVMITRLLDGQWTAPVEAAFSEGVHASAPHFAPDGRSVLFASTRPTGEGSAVSRDGSIWRVSWDGSNWGEPEVLPAPINSGAHEIQAVEVEGGGIYFSSTRSSENGPAGDLYRAAPAGSGYRIEALSALNTAGAEATLYVTPDEQLIVFHRSGDPRGVGKDDLFAARRSGSGWGEVVHLGGDANSSEFEYGPAVSRDGRRLHFTTHRDGQVRIMTISMADAWRE